MRELGDLTRLPVPAADKAMWSAARVRVQASQRDHLEAQLADYRQGSTEVEGPSKKPVTQPPSVSAPDDSPDPTPASPVSKAVADSGAENARQQQAQHEIASVYWALRSPTTPTTEWGERG